MRYILKVNALYTKGKYIIEESMVPVKKSFIHHFPKLFNLIEMTWQAIDDFKLVTVSNTEYKLEMITGLDGTGGPRIARILGRRTFVLLEELC